MLGPFATTSRLTPIQHMSLAVLSRAACASMSMTTPMTTTTTTRDRGDRYGPMEWAQSSSSPIWSQEYNPPSNNGTWSVITSVNNIMNKSRVSVSMVTVT